jgi:multiple sugar transport system ATP-binding protein
MAGLQLKGVAKRYGATTVIHHVDLDVSDGEFVVFVGPSGCGKSTLLRMIAGLESVSDGDILIDGLRVNDVSAAQRGLAMVFQSYALYPHMTVYQNLAFGLENLRTARATIEAKVREAAQMLRLDALLERRPTQLSGGQRQRVAIGRAIVRDPTIFLFDEPLSNLDAELRVQMRAEITALHARLGTTMIYVTHDQVEAMTMADRIVVLRAGRVEQVGTPLELYNRPDNRFVAGFIGSPQMNFLSGRIAAVREAGAHIALDAAPNAASDAALPLRGSSAAVQQPIRLGIRPEHVMLGAAAAGSMHLTATIDRIEQLGAASFLYCSLESGEPLTVHAAGQVKHASGEQVTVNLPITDTHLFDASGTEAALALR